MQTRLSFRPVEIQHRELFQPYLTRNSRTCDRTFANLFCWQHYYRTQWTEAGGFLIVRAHINGERRAAYILASQEETPSYIGIIPLLEEDAAKNNLPLTLMGLNDTECEELQRQLPGQFVFDRNRDFADYIYSIEDLKTLTGRKYAQKRNHVNKFKSIYDYRYDTITTANIGD